VGGFTKLVKLQIDDLERIEDGLVKTDGAGG